MAWSCSVHCHVKSSVERAIGLQSVNSMLYREDYVRKQKEKLCGRKSLDERLKSLESGASVKLEVRWSLFWLLGSFRLCFRNLS